MEQKWGEIKLYLVIKPNFETVSYFLHINFNVFLEIVAVEIEDQVMNKVEAIAHNDQRKLICKLGLLQKRS